MGKMAMMTVNTMVVTGFGRTDGADDATRCGQGHSLNAAGVAATALTERAQQEDAVAEDHPKHQELPRSRQAPGLADGAPLLHDGLHDETAAGGQGRAWARQQGAPGEDHKDGPPDAHDDLRR